MSEEKKKLEKEIYEPALMEKILFIGSDIIATSTDLGDGGDIDDDGWTNTSDW